MDASDDLSSLVFYRRHNIQRTAREVDRRRQSELKGFSFPDIVFIAAFGGVSDISKYTPPSVQRARQRNTDFSFFDYWQKYCKALLGPARTLAIYEGAIFLTAESLPKDEVQGWHERHGDTFSRIQQLSQTTLDSPQLALLSRQDDVPRVASKSPRHLSSEDRGIQVSDKPAKRRRVEETSIQLRYFEPPNDRVFPMQLAARDGLTTILSNGLWEGLQTSEVWTNEPQQSLTQTFCLFWPEAPGDFIVDLIVSGACVRAVSEAIRQSRDALRKALGDFLFKGMMTSDYVTNGGELTEAVITRDYEHGDGIVRIVLNHLHGWEASRIFPSAADLT